MTLLNSLLVLNVNLLHTLKYYTWLFAHFTHHYPLKKTQRKHFLQKEKRNQIQTGNTFIHKTEKLLNDTSLLPFRTVL